MTRGVAEATLRERRGRQKAERELAEIKKASELKPVKLMEILERGTDPATGDMLVVTRADKIVAYLRTNVPITAAAAAVGCTKDQLYNWLRIGAAAQLQQASPKPGHMTAQQRACLDFTRRCDAAIAEGHIRAAGALTRLAEGGIEEVVRTEKVAVDSRGRERLIEKSEKAQKLAPNVAALSTLLSRRWPETWAPKGDEQVASGGGGGVRVSVGELAEVIDGLHDKISRRARALVAITGEVVEAEAVESSNMVADQPSEQEHDPDAERTD